MAFGVVGMLGMIPFYCSGKTIYTFNDLHRSNSMRFARHEVIGRKPVLESLAGSFGSCEDKQKFDGFTANFIKRIGLRRDLLGAPA